MKADQPKYGQGSRFLNSCFLLKHKKRLMRSNLAV